jgi:hypothetical protein
MTRLRIAAGKLSIVAVTMGGVVASTLAGCSGTQEPAKVAVPTKPAELKPGETPLPVPKVEDTKPKGKTKKK